MVDSTWLTAYATLLPSPCETAPSTSVLASSAARATPRPPAPATSYDCSDLALCKPIEPRAPVPAGSLRYNNLDDAKSVLMAACKREDGTNVELHF